MYARQLTPPSQRWDRNRALATWPDGLMMELFDQSRMLFLSKSGAD
jgi:hypothetical protein